MKRLPLFFAALFMFVLIAVPILAEDFEIIIEVAPNVLNLGSEGNVVTIHTDIPYSQVMGSSVSLNELEISSWKADNRGYFVAKFELEEVKALPLELSAYNLLKIEGTTVNEDTFWGSAQIMVVNNSAKGK